MSKSEDIVVSDDLPDEGANQVEAYARSPNPCLAVVRTVSQPVRSTTASGSAVRFEKPSELSVLAEILGVAKR